MRIRLLKMANLSRRYCGAVKKNRGAMISTVAFACVSPNRVRVRRVEITPELEASLGCIHAPVDR
jgi:hypothetical protein